METRINFVSLDHVGRIIDKYCNGEEYLPDELDNFIAKDGDRWISVCNGTGDAFTEDFETLDEAVRYLLVCYLEELDADK